MNNSFLINNNHGIMRKFFIFSILCLLMCFSFTPTTQAQDNCTITTLPFTEGFEGVSSGVPSCFTRNPLGLHPINGILQPYVAAYMPHSGSKAMRGFNNSYTDTAAQVPTFIFPELSDQLDITSIVLEFWARTADYTNYHSLIVGVMDDPTDLSTFTNVQTLNFATQATYEKFTVYFSSYTGTGKHIAIKIANTNPLSYGETFIDDIVLDEVTPCLPVLNLAVNNFFESDVTINWNPNPVNDAGNYNVTLFDVENNSVLSTTSTSDTFYTFSGLDPLTHYRAYVEAVCGAGLSSPTDSVDFTTAAPSVPYPYSEDFEGDATLAMSVFTLSGDGINQWTYGAATGKPDPENPSAAVHSLYVSADSGATYQYDIHQASTSYAVFNVSFPSNDIEYHLSFDYKVKGHHSGYMAFDYLSVIMIDASDEMSTEWDGTPIGTGLLVEAANVTEWEHQDIILNNVAGSSKQIIFFWKNFGTSDNLDLNPPAAIDNISIYGNTCPQPSGLIATNVDMESATLSWDAGSASAWTLYFKQSDLDTAYTQVPVSGDTFLVVTGLTANTDYEFYVVADCGDEESVNSDIYTFRTACGVITNLPYAENFESGIYSSANQADYISCWNRYASDLSHYPYISNSSWYAHNGYYMLDFHYTPNCYNIAIMPELSSDFNVSDLMISFYACHTLSPYYGSLGTLEVGVMTDPAIESSFVPVDTINITAYEQYEYSEQTISFVNYTGTGKFIAFRVSNSSDCGYYIDDILLEDRPDCMYPNALTCESVGTDSATLSWTEMGEATSWNIQYGVAGFTLDGDSANILVVNTNPYTVTGLTNLTAYDFYVQSNCGESQSEWIGPLSVVTGVVNIGTIGSDSLTTCGAIICDNGGFNGDYSPNCDYMLVVYPATAGSGLQITGICDLSIGSYGYSESHLYFHDGVGTAAPLIANITGIDGNIAVAASGPITIHFTSAYYTAAGFMLEVACASCTPPSNITASNIQNNSITLSWTGNADQYAVYMSGDATGYYTTNNNSIVISNLTSNSNYTFQVRSLCGTDSSLLSPAINASTTCDALTITMANPWTENFEGYLGSGNQPFECWARPVVDATYGSPFVYCGWTPSCHSGANSAEFKGSNAILVLPVFSNDVHELRLSFWATSTDPSAGTLEVGVMSDFNDPSTFELVDICGEPGPRGNEGDTANGNFMGPYDFANVVATNGRIALRYTNNSAWVSWNLDDFVVEIAPDCSMPTGLTVSNITQTSATATWTAGGNETAWKLQYKQAGTSDWGSEISLTTTTYDITGLNAETVYQVRVKSDCGDGGESAWTNPFDFFTTPLPVIQPTVVTYAATDITQTAGTMNGAITGEGNQTIILKGFEWKLASDDSFTPVVTLTGNTLTYTLAGLNPNTCVNYRAYATTPVGTVYGETMTFCTLPDDTPDPCDVPTGLHVITLDNGEHTNQIVWDENDNVSQWNVQYKTESTDWTTETVNVNHYQIENVIYNVTYQIRVQAICDNGMTSDWTSPVNMIILCGIDNYLLNSISLYPNPANDIINVECTINNVQIEAMEVFDVYGKLINTVNVMDSPTQINVSSLASGMYFVRVTTGEGVVTKSFVKR